MPRSTGSPAPLQVAPGKAGGRARRIPHDGGRRGGAARRGRRPGRRDPPPLLRERPRPAASGRARAGLGRTSRAWGVPPSATPRARARRPPLRSWPGAPQTAHLRARRTASSSRRRNGHLSRSQRSRVPLRRRGRPRGPPAPVRASRAARRTSRAPGRAPTRLLPESPLARSDARSARTDRPPSAREPLPAR